ncbi:MAG: hypothetical protein ACKVU1_16345 [bacterium]
MRTQQFAWTNGSGWKPPLPGAEDSRTTFVLLFGSTGALREKTALAGLYRVYGASKSHR